MNKFSLSCSYNKLTLARKKTYIRIWKPSSGLPPCKVVFISWAPWFHPLLSVRRHETWQPSFHIEIAGTCRYCIIFLTCTTFKQVRSQLIYAPLTLARALLHNFPASEHIQLPNFCTSVSLKNKNSTTVWQSNTHPKMGVRANGFEPLSFLYGQILSTELHIQPSHTNPFTHPYHPY